MNAISPKLRTALSIGAVLLFICFAQARDLFSDFTRPAVTFALHLLGIGAADRGESIAVGRLVVPWSRDCAGLNLLLVLGALAIWVNRSEKIGRLYLLKIALTVPAALLANVLRVLTLIGYREAFYPHVESPQLHYFMGLVWLLPFVMLVLPRSRRPRSHLFLEALQAASIIALLAPMSGTPGGQAGAVAALVALSRGGVQTDFPRQRKWLTLAWMLLALGISVLGMESFWLPWMLTCPLLTARGWIFSITGALLTAATHPLFGMIPGGTIVTWFALALLCWKQWRGTPSDAHTASPQTAEVAGGWMLKPTLTGVFFVLPFIASTFFVRAQQSFTPPAGVAYKAIASDSYDVRVPGQPENMDLVWFNPSGNGRHHSMKVCMKYRGIELEPSPDCAEVSTDGYRWMREFYLLDGKLVSSYAGYILRTFRPLSSAGVHLIFVAKSDQMTAAAFSESCQKLAAHLEDADGAAVCVHQGDHSPTMPLTLNSPLANRSEIQAAESEAERGDGILPMP